jgi:hypothetical protein
METVFIALVCLGLLLCGLVHLILPETTERLMSRSVYVRIAGAILLIMTMTAIRLGYYLLAALFLIFGLPRLLTPDRSIRLQQRLYSRRVHGLVLTASAIGLWIVFRLLH